MKGFSKYFFAIIGTLVIALFFSCVYLYPTTRDEFYYLGGMTNVFAEYKNSYFHVNARIGQFFSNLAGRSTIFEFIISGFIFIGFFYSFYYCIFFEKFSFSLKGATRMLVISSIFIYLINYFGEMFFYIPYSTNYTLLNIFYLLYIYLFIQFFIYRRDVLEKSKTSVIIILLLGFFIGMGNEHIPPVLILTTGIGILSLLSKKGLKLFLSSRFIFLFMGIILGYVALFFAPANRVRFQREGKDAFGFNFLDYFTSLENIGKLYFYYNFELAVVFLLCVAIFVNQLIRKKLDKSFVYEILSYFSIALIAIFIAAYSPIIGSRLLFFSNVLMIVACIKIIFKIVLPLIKNSMLRKIVVGLSVVYIVSYFFLATLICYFAQMNSNGVIADIRDKSLKEKNVIIEKGFDYFLKPVGNFNRKILLDSGEDYIDSNPKENTPQEKNIILFFKINSLSTQNEKK